MRFRLPYYTPTDYTIMGCTVVPFTVVLNILIFGWNYFSSWHQFLLATLITLSTSGITYILCICVAAILKRRLPADEQVKKRLTLMIFIFLIISGLYLYSLFSLYALIRFYGYSFNRSSFMLAYMCVGVLNVFLTFLHEGVARFERWRVSLLETEELKKTVKQGQLIGLKSQVNPHFLFNCLNSLSSLINESTEDAENFLNEMSKVYRYMLRNSEDLLVQLDKEIGFIESYYTLLKARFGDGIEMQINVQEKDRNSLLPPLSLQVVLENAFSQNIIQRSSPLKISILSNNKGAIIVQNNIQRKAITDAFDYEAGLDNLVSKYRLLNQGELVITDNVHERIIELPLITKETEVAI